MKNLKTFVLFGTGPKTLDDKVSESLRWHSVMDIPLHETVYRIGSEAHLALAEEMRQLHLTGRVDLCEIDRCIIEETELGAYGMFGNTKVPLDCPMDIDDADLHEAEYKGKKVQLNKPKRNSSGGKKYVVFTRNSNGNVIKVQFGDMKGGLTSKINDPEARANFAKRHSCDTKTDKTTPGYWSCRLPRYAKLLGLKASGAKWW